MAMEEGTKFMLLAPLVEHQKGTHKDLFAKLKKDGFVRVRVGGQLYSLDEVPELEKNKKHTIDLVVDRLVIKDGIKKRLADSVELALEKGDERMIVSVVGGENAGDTFMSTLSTCPSCKISMPRLTPQLFSFNSPQGACPTCNGIGSVEYFEPDLIAPNKGLSLNEGGVIPWNNATRQRQYGPQLKKLGARHGFTLDTPLADFSDKAWAALFYGDNDTGWHGVVPILEYGREQAGVWDHWTARFQQSRPCPSCEGARLKPEALAVRVADKNMVEFTSMSIQRALDWLKDLKFSGHDTLISEPLLKELTHRLGFMVNVGLEYLSLGRNMATLSGGEAQRIRLASQLGSGLVGVTYVLDEPSIGLHPRDNQRLLDTLRSLQRRGNTVLVVEHDEPTIREADHVIEIGPSSGWLGGEIVFQGKVEDLLKADSLTGKYLRGDLFIAPPETRRKPKGQITLKKVQTNNLKDLDVDVPLGVMTCVTGVSGSGKSSLVMDSLYKHLLLHQGQKANDPGKIGGIQGIDKIEKVISIDQSPIGRTPRSNPATYTKIFDEIRKIFAGAKESRTRGYQPGRFSFNVKGGRCEACKGDGQIRVEMHFLPDVYVTCETCKGKRYNAQTLEVEYRGKNISDVLDMTVRQAREFFANHPALMRKLDVLADVGLDYLRLGQPATTLSGGEAQRIKISRELGKRSLPGALYILDEPTTGLHMHEVGKLIRVLHALVDKNATVIVIEHNTDVIMASDHVIDLGPGGGEHGGQIVASGTPEEIIANPESVTGKFLV
jgi:excinuclease ABC subunit A